MRELNIIERSILDAAFAGDGKVLRILRSQMGRYEVIARDFTGVGFFTELGKLNGVNPNFADFEISDIEGRTASLKNGFGSVLFIRAGQVQTIECFTYEEPWPRVIDNFELYYADDRTRNFDSKALLPAPPRA